MNEWCIWLTISMDKKCFVICPNICRIGWTCYIAQNQEKKAGPAFSQAKSITSEIIVIHRVRKLVKLNA